MVEGLLGHIVLGKVESCLVLRSLHVNQSIGICIFFEKLVEQVCMAMIGSIVQGGPVTVVDSINIRSEFKQLQCCLKSTLFACHVQRRALLLIGCFNICLSVLSIFRLQEHKDQVLIVVKSSDV